MKLRVTEEFTIRGKGVHIVQHAPCWAFVKRIPGTPSALPSHGGWRVAARLHDKSTPTGEGAEVESQRPSPVQLKKLADAWALQKQMMKSEGWYTFSGLVSNILLFERGKARSV